MPAFSLRGSLLGTCAAAVLALGAAGSVQAQVTQIQGGGATLPVVVYNQIFTAIQTQFDPTVKWSYAGVGSGAGLRGVLCNDGAQVPLAGASPPVVHFGGSDSLLSSTQIARWNNSQNSNSTPGSTTCSTTGAAGTIGRAQGGPLLQVPTIGTPVVLGFNLAGKTANGALTFTDSQLCGIFSGKISSWNDALLSGIATRNPPSGPITVVYRSDGSGTTALFTTHLAAVCNAGNSNITFSTTQTFAQLFAGGTPPANFVGGSGNGGVSTAVGLSTTGTGTAGAIGYLSPDFTQAAPSNTSKITQFAPVAKLINHTSGVAELPSYARVTLALGAAPLPAAPLSGTALVPIVADPPAGYPIVGYTTLVTPVCYTDSNIAAGIAEFLFFMLAEPNIISLIQQQGFVQLPDALAQLVNDNILSDANGYHLDLQSPAICQAAGASGAGTFPGR